MYSTLPTFILGFHGCDQSVVDEVINGKQPLYSSKNDYDWLGHGIYFWENDPLRALEFAQFLQNNPIRGKKEIEKPAVLGAIIDLGHCLNLMETKNLQLLKWAYDFLYESIKCSEDVLPKNTHSHLCRNDLLLRRLDCAVIEFLHNFNKSGHDFDSVRGLFFEGEDLYPDAGFKTKNHIQVCVRNPNCIKGYFLPLELNSKHPTP